MNNGWVKLHRKLLNSSIWDNADLLKMAIWCLLKASHTEHRMMVGTTEIVLQEGQFVTGRTSGSKELGVTPSSWYKRMLKLEKVGFCNIKSNNKYSLVTIENWALYQHEDDEQEQEKEQQSNNKVTTKEQQSNTNKNGKKEKNGKNVSSMQKNQDIHNPLNHVPDNPKVAQRLEEMRKRIRENAEA